MNHAPELSPKTGHRRNRSTRADHETLSTTALRWSQTFFWICAGLCLFFGTGVFAWRVWQGKAASIEWGNLRITSQQAENLVAGAKDKLIVVRTTLDDAISTQTLDLLDPVLGDFDDVLKSLGVAEGTLKRQQLQIGGGIDEFYPQSGMVDDEGFDWGGSGTPPSNQFHKLPSPADKTARP